MTLRQCQDGINRLARIPIIANTTSNSLNVNPFFIISLPFLHVYINSCEQFMTLRPYVKNFQNAHLENNEPTKILLVYTHATKSPSSIFFINDSNLKTIQKSPASKDTGLKFVYRKCYFLLDSRYSPIASRPS